MICDLSASDDSQLTEKCDVCVIGGGIAGLISVHRDWKAASGRRVIVLESGDPGSRLVDSTPSTRLGWASGITLRECLRRPGACAGRDSSNTWGGRIMPLAPHDMGPRDYVGLPAWPIDRAELRIVSVPDIEHLFHLDQSSYEGLPSSPSRPDPLPAAPGKDMATARWSKCRSRPFAGAMWSAISEDTVAKQNPEIWINATVFNFVFDAEAGPPQGRSRPRASAGKRLESYSRLVRFCGRDIRNNKAFA